VVFIFVLFVQQPRRNSQRFDLPPHQDDLLFFRAEQFKRILHGHPSLIKLQKSAAAGCARPVLW
jgi:hypothetical protein